MPTKRNWNKKSGRVRGRYVAKTREIWGNDNDMSPDEKYRECYKLSREVEEARKPDPEIME